VLPHPSLAATHWASYYARIVREPRSRIIRASSRLQQTPHPYIVERGPQFRITRHWGAFMSQTDKSHQDSLSSQLPGTWQLESRIDVTASGQRRPEPSLGDDPIALLIYDRAGHFAAQFMKRDRSVTVPDGPSRAQNNSRAQGGYDAYFGTYTVDDRQGTVTQCLLGALSQENVGSVLTRAMEVRGNSLVIKLQTTSGDGVAVTRTLTWRRVG